MSESNNKFAESFVREFGGLYLDSNNILWKLINNEWIGKRSVYTNELRALWLEDAKESSIRSWWCGKDSDYNETFKR